MLDDSGRLRHVATALNMNFLDRAVCVAGPGDGHVECSHLRHCTRSVGLVRKFGTQGILASHGQLTGKSPEGYNRACATFCSTNKRGI
jgi:hypothetical protein